MTLSSSEPFSPELLPPELETERAPSGACPYDVLDDAALLSQVLEIFDRRAVAGKLSNVSAHWSRDALTGYLKASAPAPLSDAERRVLITLLPAPPSHQRVLGEIGRHEGVMAREIAAALLQDKGLITRVTRELVRDGLIERHPHPSDSRAAHLMLSAEGRALCERLDAIEQTLEAQMVADLSPERASDFIETVNAMTEQLDREQESP